VNRALFELGSDPYNNYNINRHFSSSPTELAFINWYYGLYGNQWRLISDILNYHPLTRGRMRSRENIEQLYN